MSEPCSPLTSYLPPDVIEYPAKWLISENGSDPPDVFLFFNRIDICRFHEKRRLPGHLLVDDQTVSGRHCVITQDPDGRCFVRDTSRNGTRVDGRRLTPNLTTELETGQVLSIGRSLQLRLDGKLPEFASGGTDVESTLGVEPTTVVTVLVGDIRNYTTLVRLAGHADLQESVNRVFALLESEVQSLGGTIKEFQGDALFAFWEIGTNECHASCACRAALHLEQKVRKWAADPSVWSLGGHPLQMDFALATGMVTISGYGAEGAMSLSMVGEPVVLAFRIEKLAGTSTGPIIVCPVTRKMAENTFEFRDLGSHQPKGFDDPTHLYSRVKAKT